MTQATITEAAPRFAPVSKNYGRYALTLLVMIYTVNFLDRQILSSIGEPIKNELHLTDSQMGALGGIFFAFVYTVLGIPIARVADKANRPWIMTIALTLWSGFTVLSAFARNFAVLAVARAGVGIGEAGCSPTAHSLLADYFPREKRATALAIYSMGISIGTLLGFAVGGMVAQKYGWRASFLVSGLPGLVFAVLAILTLREPRSQLTRDARASADASSHISLLMVFSALEKRPTFWLFSFAGAFFSFVSYAQSQFLTPFFLRNHASEITALAAQFNMAPKAGAAPLAFISLALGLAAGIGGAFGSWFGGVAADKWGATNIRNYTLFPMAVPLLTTPVLWYAASTDNMALALPLMILPNIAVGAWWGPVYGGVQGLVPPAMRALSAAICLFVINMVGLGGGPTAFGIVTSQMTNHYLAGSGLDAAICTTAIGAAKTACGVAAAHGIKTTVYLSTLILPIAMLCLLVSRWTIKADVEHAEVLPDRAITTGRLAFYMFIGIGLPGFFLGNASAMFFKTAPHSGVWVDGMLVGTLIGGLIGVVIALMVAAAGRRNPA
jgi:predicted MFS family arabinose efflux permease